MKLTETHLQGAFVIELEPIRDERGFFARAWCSDTLEQRGLIGSFVQSNLSFTTRRGTVRGMHHQAAPHAETKVVRCVRGAIHDVLVDLRPGSTTRFCSVAIELSADNRKSVYVPDGIAHGFQSLTDDAEVLYEMSERYRPHLARGVRFDDPRLAIDWPLAVSVIAERDRNWPLIEEP